MSNPFLKLHHLEFRCVDPLSMARHIARLFDGETGLASPGSTSVMVTRLPWGLTEFKTADAKHPVGGSVIALEIEHNEHTIAWLQQHHITPDLSKMQVPTGPIFFTVARGEDSITFHTINWH